MNLARQLQEAPKRDFRSELRVYDAVFKSVCEQVTVHCSERGEVLDRLRQFYTRSTDVTARVAETAVRTEISKRVDELEAEVADLQSEVAYLRTRQMSDDVEKMVMRLFRELPERKQVRTLSVLYAEAGKLLMANADDDTGLLPPDEQASTINHLMLSHEPDERVDVLTALVAIAPVNEQFKLLRRLLGTLPMADQIKMSMSILVPEQHRRIFLGIFDSTRDEHEKATLLLDALQSMQSSKQISTLSLVLSATRPDDLLASLRFVVDAMPWNDAVALISEIVQLLEACRASTSVKQWATDIMAKEQAALAAVEEAPSHVRAGIKDHKPARRRPASGTGSSLDSVRVAGSAAAASSEHAAEHVFTLARDLLDLLGSERAVELLTNHVLESDDKESMLTLLVSGACGDGESMARVMHGLLRANPSVLQAEVLKNAIVTHLAEDASGGPKFVASAYEGQSPEGRIEILRELTNSDAFGTEECEMLIEYLGAVCPLSMKKFVEDMFGTGGGPRKKSKVVKRKAKAEDGELIPLDQAVRMAADIFTRKIKEDIAADRKSKPRHPWAKFMREYMFRQYGFKKVADKANKDLRHSARQCASTPGPFASRMQMFTAVLGAGDEAVRWSDGKSHFYLSFFTRTIALDRVAEAEPHIPYGKLKLDTKDEAGPFNLKEQLIKELLHVRLAAAQASLEHLILDARVKKDLHFEIMRMAVLPQPAAPQPATADGAAGVANEKADSASTEGPKTKMVNLDDALGVVMKAWQRAADQKTKENRARLDALFEETDEDGSGFLEFGEFRQLAMKARPELSREALLDMFDTAISMASEEMGEEMDAITREAFVTTATREGLVSLGTFAFRDPSEVTMGKAVTAGLEDGAGGSPAHGGKLQPKQGGKWQARQGAVVSGFEKGGKLTDANTAPLAHDAKDPRVRSVLEAAMKPNFLFRHLFTAEHKEQLEEVIAFFEPCALEEGDKVIKQGSRGDYFYVCESGKYDMLVDGVQVHTYEPNADDETYPCFGELSLMYAKPHAATVIVNEQGYLWRLGRAGFRMAHAQARGTDLMKLLHKVELFSPLRFDQLQMLRDHIVERTFEPGECVVREGEPGEALYVIVKGSALVIKAENDTARRLGAVGGSYKRRQENKEGIIGKEVAILGESEYFGERALLKAEAHDASVVASADEPLATAYLTRADFEKSLGPLQPILDAERMRCEAKAAERAKQLEVHGLSHVSRGGFALVYRASIIPHGELYLARHLTTNATYTIRQEVKDSVENGGERLRLEREVGALRAVNEAATRCMGVLPTLLRAFETTEATSFLRGSGSVYLLFRQRAVCSLGVLLRDHGGTALGETETRFVGACITQALDVLHGEALHISHNLSLDSLHVLEDGYICLMDMRFARRNDGACQTLCGPVNQYAPEQLRGEVHGTAVDWWAMGTLLHELITGNNPWEMDGVTDGIDTEEIFRRIMSHTAGAIEFTPEAAADGGHVSVSADLTDLVNALLHPDVGDRLGSDEDGGGDSVKGHQWFAKTDWVQLIDCAAPSPLVDGAQKHQSRALSDSTPEDLPEGQPSGETYALGEETLWLTGLL